MKHWLCILAVTAATTPAFAQDDAIYAPCLNQFPVPQEFGSAGDFAAAMEADGWVHQTTEDGRAAATPALAQVAGFVFLSSELADAAEVQDFADQSLTRYGAQSQFFQLFTRDEMSASVSAIEIDPGSVTVSCVFAGPDVPGVRDLIASDETMGQGSPVLVRLLSMDTPDGVIRFGVVALQLQAEDAILAPISGREGIQLTYQYRVPE